jgi:hypothetical protein
MRQQVRGLGDGFKRIAQVVGQGPQLDADFWGNPSNAAHGILIAWGFSSGHSNDIERACQETSQAPASC